MTELSAITPPSARVDFLGAPGLEEQLVQAMNAGALANGWLITGGAGSGKATLAYRLARALLKKGKVGQISTLEISETDRTYSLVASGGHPDLFVAQRFYDEKKERLTADIPIEEIRNLTRFLSHTPSFGGWRVAIIDTAEDLNRNSANALLKALEEPPPFTAIFILSASPGKLLATIRSRCRKIALRPLPDDVVAEFLIREGVAGKEDAARIARASGGRPGFALSLASGDGAEAIEALDAFHSALKNGKDPSEIAQRLAAKNAEGIWALFASMLIERLASDASDEAKADGPSAGMIVDLREHIDALFTRGEAVNLDRTQMVMAAGRAYKNAFDLTR